MAEANREDGWFSGDARLDLGGYDLKGLPTSPLTDTSATSRAWVLSQISSAGGGGGGGTNHSLLTNLDQDDHTHYALADGSRGAFAAATHTHAASAIASGTFADARISESSVTQHEAALEIDFSQLTSVPAYVLDSDARLTNARTPVLTGVETNQLLTWDGSAIADFPLGSSKQFLRMNTAGDAVEFAAGDTAFGLEPYYFDNTEPVGEAAYNSANYIRLDGENRVYVLPTTPPAGTRVYFVLVDDDPGFTASIKDGPTTIATLSEVSHSCDAIYSGGAWRYDVSTAPRTPAVTANQMLYGTAAGRFATVAAGENGKALFSVNGVPTFRDVIAADVTGLATVALTNSYSDLVDKPTLLTQFNVQNTNIVNNAVLRWDSALSVYRHVVLSLPDIVGSSFNSDLDANGYKMINLADPEDPQDAATKAYVDVGHTVHTFATLPALATEHRIRVSAVDPADSTRKDFSANWLPVPQLTTIADRLATSNYGPGSMLIAPEGGVKQLHEFDGTNWLIKNPRPRNLGIPSQVTTITDAQFKYSGAAPGATYSTSLTGVFVGDVGGGTMVRRSYFDANVGTLSGTLAAGSYILRLNHTLVGTPAFNILISANQFASEPTADTAWAGVNYITSANVITSAAAGWKEVDITDILQGLINRDGAITQRLFFRLYESATPAAGVYYRIFDATNAGLEPTWRREGVTAETEVVYNGVSYIQVASDPGGKGLVLRRATQTRPCEIWTADSVYGAHIGVTHVYDLRRALSHRVNLSGNTTATFANARVGDFGFVDFYNTTGASCTIAVNTAAGYTLEGTRPTTLATGNFVRMGYVVRQKPGVTNSVIIDTTVAIAEKAIV